VEQLWVLREVLRAPEVCFGFTAAVTSLHIRNPVKAQRFHGVVTSLYLQCFYPKLLSGLVLNSLKRN
jgi:hypothetical protein